jgi:glycosyltransferase involved in cell wall biosynthesis
MKFSIIVPAYQAATVLPFVSARCSAGRSIGRSMDHRRRRRLHRRTADAARQALRDFPAVQVIRAEHGGPAHARNLGARSAQGDLLLFTDADCEPAQDWIEHFARAFVEPSISGAKGTYATRQRSLVARFVQQEYEERYDHTRRQTTIDFIDTYSAAYRRTVFIDNAGFDVSFPTASVEDQEFSFRLVERGHRLVFVPEAKVYHRHNTTLTRYFRRKYNIGYWKMYLLKRHPGKAVRDSHTPQLVKVQIILLAAALAGTLSVFLPPGSPLIAIGLWRWPFRPSMLPLLIKIARRDPPVLLIAPIMIVVRALALGLGLFSGALRFHVFRRDSPPL